MIQTRSRLVRLLSGLRLSGLRLPAVLLPAVLLLGVVTFPGSAQAWWRGGVFVGAPIGFGFYGPPIFYPPPVYYAPPPVLYSPPTVVYSPEPVSAHSCGAGAYICPLEHASPVGSPCTCPTNQGRAAGQTR